MILFFREPYNLVMETRWKESAFAVTAVCSGYMRTMGCLCDVFSDDVKKERVEVMI